MIFQLLIEKALMGVFARLFGCITFENLTANILADGSFARFSLKRLDPRVAMTAARHVAVLQRNFRLVIFFMTGSPSAGGFMGCNHQ